MFRIYLRTRALSTAALVILSAAPAWAYKTDLCGQTRYSAVNSELRVQEDPSIYKECFETHLPSAGLLMLDIAASDIAQPKPRLELLGNECYTTADRPESFTYQERTATSLLATVPEAGSYFFCISAQDPIETIGDYRLFNGFATANFKDDPDEYEPDPEPILNPPRGDFETEVFYKEDPDEYEPDPEPIFSPPGSGFSFIRQAEALDIAMAFKDDPDEYEPDPEPIVFPPGDGSSFQFPRSFFDAGGFHKDDPDEYEPDPEPFMGTPRSLVSLLAQQICRSNRQDDHAETFFCATSLLPHQEVPGEIGKSRQDDADLFTFILDDLTTIRIETTGDSDTFGGLYDRHGYLLQTDDDGGAAANFRMIRTLNQGRYFVRVTGRHNAEGPYGISVANLSPLP